MLFCGDQVAQGPWGVVDPARNVLRFEKMPTGLAVIVAWRP